MKDKKIYFTWDIHYKCNFRCPYCWFFKQWSDISRRNIYFSPEEWMAHWRRIYDKYGSVRIEITGGEPFLYPKFIELVKLLSSIHFIKVTTNMSGDIEAFAREVDPQRVNLDMNFHPLFADIDVFIKKALILKNAGFKAGVCYLAYPPQMGKIDMFRKRFEESGISFALAAFWGDYDGKRYPQSYTKDEIEFIRPFLGDIDRIMYHLNAESSKGKICNAGYKYAVVQADGKVVRCGQIVDKAIGNILNDDFKLLDKPSPCEAEFCPCNEYINITEEKNTESGTIFNSEFIKIESSNEKKETSPLFPRLEPPYRVSWNWEITHECNYRCSYCPAWREENKKKVRFADLDTWVKIWDKIFIKYGCTHIRFSGGEPNVYPNFFDLVASLSYRHTIDITTNLSFDITEFMKKVKPEGVMVSPSFHPEYADVNSYLENVLILKKNNYFLTGICYVAYPPNLEKLKMYKEIIEEKGFDFKLIPFHGEYKNKTYPKEYTEEENALLKEVSNSSVAKELNTRWYEWEVEKKEIYQVKGKLCRMGQMYAKITPDGEVTRCCASGSGRLGNIFDEDFRLLDAPAPCKVDKCPCFKAMRVGEDEDKWLPHWKTPEHHKFPKSQSL